MKIIYSEAPGAQGPEEKIVREILTGHDVSFTDQPLTPETATDFEEADVVSIFINSRVTAAILDQLPQLRVLSTRSTGVDHVDTKAVKTGQIAFHSVPGYSAAGVTERLFELGDAIGGYGERISEGLRRDPQTRMTLPRAFEGKDIGLVGYGNQGRHFAKELLRLGVDPERLRVHNPHYRTVKNGDGIQYSSNWEAFLKDCDVISFHCPATDETRGMFNSEAVSACRAGLVVLTTARGELVSNYALRRGLDSGKVGAAGLDVFTGMKVTYDENKARIANHAELTPGIDSLRQQNRVVLTPHTAFATKAVLEHLARTSAEQIRESLRD